MGSCAAPSAKGDDKFITTDYLQQCQEKFGLDLGAMCRYDKPQHVEFKVLPDQTIQFRCSWFEGGGLTWWPFYTEHDVKSAEATSVLNDIFQGTEGHDE